MFHENWKSRPISDAQEMNQLLIPMSLSAFYCLDLLNSLQWKLEKKHTPSGILGNASGNSAHYHQLVRYK